MNRFREITTLPEFAPPNDPAEPRMFPSTQTARTVLCVDDQDTNRYVRSRVLRAAGFHVVEAADGVTALRLAGEILPSLILLDIRLPDLDGFEVCKRLKSDPRTNLIPVLHISAVGRLESDFAEALDHQSDAYLQEPVEPEALVAITNALIRAAERHKQSRSSEARYRQLLESAMEGVCVMDEQGRTEFVNQRMAEMLKFARSGELLGRDAFEFFAEEDRERLKAVFAERLASDGRDRHEAWMRCADGSTIWVSLSGSNLTDERGRAIGRMVLVTDITEQKRAQDALRDSEAQFRALANSIPQLCWMANADGWIFWYNQRWYDYTGTTPEQMAGWGWQSVHDPDVLPHVLEEWRAAIANNRLFEMVFPLRGADGTFRPFLTRIVPVRDQNGQVTRWFGTNTDISEQARNEQTLKRQAELLKLSFDAILVWRVDGTIESWNLGAERLYGIPEAEALGRVSQELLGTTFPKPWSEIRSELIEKRFWEGELVQRVRDGRQVVVNAKLQLIGGADSSERVLEITRDITDRKKAEDAVRESRAKLEAALASMTDAVLISDAEGRHLDFNEAFAKFHRFRSKDECPQVLAEYQEIFEVYLPDGTLAPVDMWAAPRALRGETVTYTEYRLRRKDTGETWVGSYSFGPIRDKDGAIVGCVMLGRDITERKQAEERQRLAQKLESIGLLAGGIAHDFNNLLTGILGNASLVLDEIGPGPARRVTEIVKSAERAADLTRQLLAYSGKGQFVVRDIDVSEAVSAIADLVQFSIPKSVEMTIKVQRRLPPVRMDPGQLQQVLMNLLINAGEAIGEGHPGRITIATSLTEIERTFVDALGAEVVPGRYVSIEVADTGAGIDAQTKERIFDPFFTTKFTGRGLGLAAVAGVLRSNKGAILLESVPGRGCTFRVLLPAVHDGAREPVNRVGAGGLATILVVDDEAAVRSFIGAALGRRGYRVLQACDGKEGLALCERESGEIAAAIVDIVMPLMGANELLPVLKARRPGMKILLTSGYNEIEARRLCASYPGATFIQKPYTAEQIESAVAALVAAARH